MKMKPLNTFCFQETLVTCIARYELHLSFGGDVYEQYLFPYVALIK